MTVTEIEEKLKDKSRAMQQETLQAIEQICEEAIERCDEFAANYAWCLKQVYIVKDNFLQAYQDLEDKKYENAWNKFDRADIELSFLENQGEVDVSDFPNKYGLAFMKLMIPRYQKLFPYHFFTSRESVIKAEKCSICGKPVSLRNRCGHKLGHLYMGKCCAYEVTDVELLGISIVTDPFDKYTFLKVEGKEYNYESLDMLMGQLKSPYDAWYIDELQVIKPEFQGVGRNSLCPCKSGKKYKKCCLGTDRIYSPHYRINLLNQPAREIIPMKFIGTWK